MRKNQHKKTLKTQKARDHNDHNTSPARVLNWAEAEMAEMTETGFRMWIKMNFSELKKHVATQGKEAKNHDKTMQEPTAKIPRIERNIIDLIELKNTLQELHNAITSINSRIEQAEKRISELEDYLSKIRQANKNKETRKQKNE